MWRNQVSTKHWPNLPREHYRERLKMRECRASLMSNTKWRKLFFSIQKLNLGLSVCRIKWLGVDTPQILRTPTAKSLDGYPYYNGYPNIVGYNIGPVHPFADFEWGPYPLCAIEWLEFPRIAMRSGKTHEQDVNRAEQALKVISRFPFENTQDGLRVIGHLP